MLPPLRHIALRFVAKHIDAVTTLSSLPEDLQAALLGAVLESHNFTEHAARLFCGCWLPNGDETFVELVCSSCGWYGEALQALGAVLFHEYDWDMFQVAVVVTRISNSPVNYPSCAQRVIDFGHAT